MNVAVSFAKSMHGPVNERGTGLLGEIRIERRGEDALATLASTNGPLPPLEIFERVINSMEMNAPDRITELEYVAALEDGIADLKESCGQSARVLTADFVNPFPGILSLPVGGGMIFIHPRRPKAGREQDQRRPPGS